MGEGCYCLIISVTVKNSFCLHHKWVFIFIGLRNFQVQWYFISDKWIDESIIFCIISSMFIFFHFTLCSQLVSIPCCNQIVYNFRSLYVFFWGRDLNFDGYVWLPFSFLRNCNKLTFFGNFFFLFKVCHKKSNYFQPFIHFTTNHVPYNMSLYRIGQPEVLGQ